VIDDVKLFYDLTAQRTADEWYEKDVVMPTIRDFCSLLPQHPRVLDLGCGPGYESMRLASTGAQVVGVDFSIESIRIARERTPQCRFEVLDFRELDDRFGTFDGVFAAASLIHISSEELPDVMHRIASILKQGGYLCAIVQHGEGTREWDLETEGHKLRRVLYRYTHQALARAAPQLTFVREGYQDPELLDRGWRCYVFKAGVPS
jgi:SAM-dependent methyltransferase